MTVVVGIKAREGAVLMSDCLVHATDDKTFTGKKIRYGMHVDKNTNRQTGAYVASAGWYYQEFDANSLFYGSLGRMHGVADLLTHPFIVAHSIEELNKRSDALRAKLRRQVDLESDSYKELCEEFEMLEYGGGINVRAFIEDRSAISSRDYTVLRISEHHEPDLIFIHNKKVKTIDDFTASGSCDELVLPYLQEHFAPDLTVNDATALAADAMNIALQKRSEYAGFDIVRAYSSEGNTIIETSLDEDAICIDVNNINWKRPFAQRL